MPAACVCRSTHPRARRGRPGGHARCARAATSEKILALFTLMSDDLDFSKPAGSPKPAAPAAPQAPIYVPAIARAFFESGGKEEQVDAGHVFFAENQKGGLFKRDKMYFLVEG